LKGTFLEPKYQLLLILPIFSIKLIDKSLQKYMTDITMGLKHLYPTEYQIQTLFKTHLWECCPILPMIDIEKIIKINNN
jgi:5'-3' exonuclease